MIATPGLQLFGQLLMSGLFGSSSGGRLTDAQRAEARERNRRAQQVQAGEEEEPLAVPSAEDSPSDSSSLAASPSVAAEVSPSPSETAFSSESTAG